MVKATTNNNKLDMADQHGMYPRIVLETSIGGVQRYWGDDTFTFQKVSPDDTTCYAKILSISDIQFKRSGLTTSTVSSVSVVLQDADEEISGIADDDLIVGTTVKIYAVFNSILYSDFFLMYEGVFSTPYTTDELNKTVALDIVPTIHTGVFPYFPSEDGTEDADINTHEKLLNKPWPVAFGRVTDLPMQLVKMPDIVQMRTPIDESGGILFTIQTEPEFTVDNPLYSSNQREYQIEREIVIGTWLNSNKKRFSIPTPKLSSRNRPYMRANTIARPIGDPDLNNTSVVWINKKLVGYWVTFTNKTGSNEAAYCTNQIGTKCWFDRPLSQLYQGNKNVNSFRYFPASLNLTVPTFSHPAGTRMRLTAANGGDKKTYIVTNGPYHDVKAVRCWRNVPVVGGPQDAAATHRMLTYVPDTYWSISDPNTTLTHDLIGDPGNRPTTMKFDQALEFRQQGWEDGIVYASVVSDINRSGGGERNPAEHIKFILENYTDYTVDTLSFSAVRYQCSFWPADWAAFKSKDALAYAAEVAAQALIALTIVGKTVKMTYLGVNYPGAGDPYSHLDQDNVLEFEEVEITDEELENITTVFTGTWNESYAYDAPQRFTVRTNVDKYEERAKTIDFNIFQKRKIVKPLIKWWARELAYPWKYVRIVATLEAFEYEPFDIVELDSSISELFPTSGDIRGRVMECRYDLSNWTVELIIKLPFTDGSNVVDPLAYKAPNVPSASDRADPFLNYPSSVGDWVEGVAEPLDGTT